MTQNQFFRGEPIPVGNLEKILPLAHDSAARRESHLVSELARLLGASFTPALRLLLEPSTLRQWRRLLQEGINPIVHLLLQANNTALINRWLNHGTKVVFLSSFPRSGNTWMRFILTDILLQMHGVETTTKLPVHPDNLITLFSGNSMVRRLTRCPRWAFKPRLAFVKTHAPFPQLERIFSNNGRLGSGVPSKDSAPIRDWRILYLYRCPEDALVSLYRLYIQDEYCQDRVLLNIDTFCRDKVSNWVKNISSYFRAADNGIPIFFLSYESLLEKPGVVLGDLLHWLDVPHDDKMVQRAVSNMQFSKLQAIEIQTNKTLSPAHHQRLFFRRGCPGSGRAELQESTLQEIRQQTEPWLREANQRQIKLLSANPAPTRAILTPSVTTAPHRNGEALHNGAGLESKTSLRPQRM